MFGSPGLSASAQRSSGEGRMQLSVPDEQHLLRSLQDSASPLQMVCGQSGASRVFSLAAGHALSDLQAWGPEVHAPHLPSASCLRVA